MISRAMRLRGLLPYAIVAAVVSLSASYAAVSSVRPATASAPPSGTPSASATARATPELSKTARLAFWRDKQLWVSNLDGSLRRALTSIEDLRRVSHTRWSLDGGAVAFVDSGLSLAVVTTDARRVDVDLPIDLRNLGYRIADIRWAPDATRVAATLLRPGDGRSDAFLVDITAERPSWKRLTSLEDLFVGDWVSNDELLASTALGAVGVLSARSANTMRLISGVQGVSPIVGPEGRIHFLVGRIPTSRDPSLAYVSANRASVWSAAVDGSDIRRETTWELNDIRLDGRLPDGRYLAHRGSSNSQGTVTDDVELLPTNAGVIERLRISPDGRSAFGFTPERIVRIDLAKLTATPPVAQNAAVTVFLETGGEADVWFPTTLSLARGAARSETGPAARSVFSLGGHVWQLDGGVATLLRPAPILRRTQVAAPRWSPTGQHVAVMEQAGGLSSSTTFVLVAIPRSGDHVRIGLSQAAARSFSWSPDGKELAVVVDGRGVSGIASDAQLEARFFDTSGRVTRPAVPANEVAWTAKGLLLLRDAGGTRQLIRIESDGRETTVTTRDRLVASLFGGSTVPVSATVSGLDAAPDGSFASVRIQWQPANGALSNDLYLLGPDGAPARSVPAGTLSDLAWSPAQPLFGYTLDVRATTERAIVRSASATDPIAVHNAARFAGWSPDGRWYYTSRITGLFAHPVAGGAEVRVGPGGAPITTASR
jgi:dipeptidyl aminopeptidase/acylaminoacyl peptidase